uniref:M-phase phosphoprotein 6 n=1 Tax=Petromyzon marinus TaxID=7757 RepID=A0AAJ7XHE6_PETMA|nr:M-phase phosphoprotein 6 [Petromyzon marinus]
MARDSSHKMKLSKNLLRMKFMQRGLDEEERKRLDEEEQRLMTDEHWYLDLPDLQRAEVVVVEEASVAVCEGVEFGRRSFRGFNPEVEKLCSLLELSRRGGGQGGERGGERRGGDEGKDVSDEEMARRFESVVGTVQRKFATKRRCSALGSGGAGGRGQSPGGGQGGPPPTKRLPPTATFLQPADDG